MPSAGGPADPGHDRADQHPGGLPAGQQHHCARARDHPAGAIRDGGGAHLDTGENRRDASGQGFLFSRQGPACLEPVRLKAMSSFSPSSVLLSSDGLRMRVCVCLCIARNELIRGYASVVYTLTSFRPHTHTLAGVSL